MQQSCQGFLGGLGQKTGQKQSCFRLILKMDKNIPTNVGTKSPGNVGVKLTRPTFSIAADRGSILCLKCGLRSWHPKDVSEKFCGRCGFHEPYGF